MAPRNQERGRPYLVCKKPSCQKRELSGAPLRYPQCRVTKLNHRDVRLASVNLAAFSLTSVIQHVAFVIAAPAWLC